MGMTPLRRRRDITNHIRLYSDDYAGEIQADYMNQDYGRDFYLALLRFDAITSRWLVISDNQFIDSSYFLSRKPVELAADLGRDKLPLVVRSRENGLGESLRRILVRSAAETLNNFQFMPIRDTQARLLLRDALSRTSVRELDRCFTRVETKLGKRNVTVPAIGISLLLRRILGLHLSRETEDDLDLMEQGWAWRLEQEGRIFPVECWRGAYAPPLVQALGIPPPVITYAGERALAEIINITSHGSTYRWDIDRLIATHEEERRRRQKAAVT